MYCPNCAEPNRDDIKYCRACGENLSVVAIAMNRHFPVSLLDRLDAYLERKNERIRRDSIVSAVSGVAFLFLCIYHLLKGDGFSFNVVFTFLFACFMFFWSLWDYLVYRRSLMRSSGKAGEHLPVDTSKMSPPSILQLEPPSVTEGTTKELDATFKRKR
jgi:hypothetical protein